MPHIDVDSDGAVTVTFTPAEVLDSVPADALLAALSRRMGGGAPQPEEPAPQAQQRRRAPRSDSVMSGPGPGDVDGDFVDRDDDQEERIRAALSDGKQLTAFAVSRALGYRTNSVPVARTLESMVKGGAVTKLKGRGRAGADLFELTGG